MNPSAVTYLEIFIDEGDVDILRVFRVLEKSALTGILIPNNAPQMTCSAAWHVGMAFVLDYLRGVVQTNDQSSEETNGSQEARYR